MEENVKELKKTIASLEDELKASMTREEVLKEQVGTLRHDSWLRQKINDPGSKFGKVVRLPRTVYRIVRYPDVRRSMRGIEPSTNEKNSGIQREGEHDEYEKDENVGLKFAEIKFFSSEDTTPRVNLIVRNIEKDMLKKAIEFANQNDCELRVVTYGEKSGVMKYRKMKEQKNFPTAKKISFYSTIEQSEREHPFELEIGKNEMFLMNEWGINEKE